MSLMILLSLALGATAGVLMVRAAQPTWRILTVFFLLLTVGFALLALGADPSRTNIRGVPLFTVQMFAGLLSVLFSLALGIGGLIAAIVQVMSKPKGRRS